MGDLEPQGSPQTVIAGLMMMHDALPHHHGGLHSFGAWLLPWLASPTASHVPCEPGSSRTWCTNRRAVFIVQPRPTTTPTHPYIRNVARSGPAAQVCMLLCGLVDKALASAPTPAGHGADVALLEVAVRGLAKVSLTAEGRHAVKKAKAIRRWVVCCMCVGRGGGSGRGPASPVPKVFRCIQDEYAVYGDTVYSTLKYIYKYILLFYCHHNDL